MIKHHACFAVAMMIGLSSGLARASDPVRLVQTGDQVPGQSVNFTSVNLAAVDGTGAAFIGNFTLGGSKSGLYNWKNGVATPIADISTPGPSGETINSIIATGDYENGVVVFAANTSAGPTLYRYVQGNGLTALVHSGDVLPGGDGSAVGSFFNRGVGGDANEFAFRTTRDDSSNAVYFSVGGFGMQAVDDKTRSGVAETGDFVNFPELHYRDGQTAFVGTGQDPDDEGAQPEPVGVFIARPGNPFEIIAARNQPIPNAHDDDDRFSEFERPRILPDGRVAFAGGFIDEDEEKAGEPDHHLGVFVRNPDLSWKIYADTDMQLPGLHAPIDEFNQYSIESGVNFFGVNDEDGGSYFYYESADGVFTKLLDTYSLLDGKALTSLRMLSDTALNGVLYFRASFADGTTGVYSMDVPEPASIALIFGAMGALGLRRRR